MRRLQRWIRREPLKAALTATLVLGIPTLSGLGGYVWASQEEIAAGEQSLHEERLEALVRAGFSGISDRAYEGAAELFLAQIGVVEREGQELAYSSPGLANRKGRVGRDRVGTGQGDRQQLVLRHDLVQQPHLQGAICVDWARLLPRC